MKKLYSFAGVCASLLLSISAYAQTAQTQGAEILFYTDFKSLPVAFTKGDINAAGKNANKEYTFGTMILGAGANGQRINSNTDQGAAQFNSGTTSYVSETANDDGATAGIVSFLANNSGGYIITPEVQGPCNIYVWSVSTTTSDQKYAVFYSEDGGEFVSQGSTTVIKNKMIKKHTFSYTGTGKLKVKIQTQSTSIGFYNIQIESAAPLTEPLINLTSGTSNQTVYPTQNIENIVYTWSGTATSATMEWTGTSSPSTAPTGITVVNDDSRKTTTVSGAPIDANAATYGYTIISNDATKASEALAGSISVKVTDKHKMAYVTTVSNGTASDTRDSYFTTALAEYFDINYISSAKTGVDYSIYDVVVLSAVPTSGDAGLVELKNVSITKPFINMKTFQMQASRWNWMTPANTTTTSIVVPEGQKKHAIFDGITLTGSNSDEIVLSTGSSVNCAVSAEWLTSSNTITTLASVKDQTLGSYFEVPIGTTLSGMTNPTTKKHIILGISEASWTTLTADAIKLAVNASKYVLESSYTGINNNNTDIEKIVAKKEYYDLTGRKVYSTADAKNVYSCPAVLIEKTTYTDGSVKTQKILSGN